MSSLSEEDQRFLEQHFLNRLADYFIDEVDEAAEDWYLYAFREQVASMHDGELTSLAAAELDKTRQVLAKCPLVLSPYAADYLQTHQRLLSEPGRFLSELMKAEQDLLTKGFQHCFPETFGALAVIRPHYLKSRDLFDWIEKSGEDSTFYRLFIHVFALLNYYIFLYDLVHAPERASFGPLTGAINDAFYRLEGYMEGRIGSYQYFGFKGALRRLFVVARMPSNQTYHNEKLISKYGYLAQQIDRDHDKSNFENRDAYENEGFNTDCEELGYVQWHWVERFLEFVPENEVEEEERRDSILDTYQPGFASDAKAESLPEVTPSRKEPLIQKLQEYGFFELQKVKVLSLERQAQLVELVAGQPLPYQIAMLHYLGYIDYLKEHYFPKGVDLQKWLATTLGYPKAERRVKGEISVLNPKSSERRDRYTSHLHKEVVEKDYQRLK